MTVGTFFSPSYIGDLERMVWLRRSIDTFNDTPTRHIIAVPRQDLVAFQAALMGSRGVEFVCQEDLVDSGFYPDWLGLMQQHIEQPKDNPWQKALLEADFNISEYTLYGVFVDELLKPDNLIARDQPFNLIAWGRASVDALRSDVLGGRPLPSDKLALCLQSNLRIPVAEYEDMLQVILKQADAGTGT